MAKKKLKKYPKKPKASASVTVLQNYITRCKGVDKENAQITAENKKRESLAKKVKSIK